VSEAHVSLGHVLLLNDWDWRRAEEEYQRAIALDPIQIDAHVCLGRNRPGETFTAESAHH
jgi:hypothetical protein